jgi:hypothetical protein
VRPVERFVHRCTSALPLNALPDDRARIVWLIERPDLRRDEADLLRSICDRLGDSQDPELAGFARAAIRSVDELAAHPAAASGPAAGGDTPAAEVRAAYGRRDYGEVMRLLHAERGDGADPRVPPELADYWLDD